MTQASDRPVIADPHATIGENHLVNLVRFVAALAVVLMHSRTILFVDYDLAPHDLLTKVAYGVTSLGKEAVTVFFVLSGFWVGGAAIRKASQHRFTWTEYLSDRWVRLSLVVLPALLLTVVLDYLGLRLFGDATVYTGDGRYNGVVGATPKPRSLALLLANALFLQGVFVSPYGSDGALWSVGYEFWMYVIGAAIIVAIITRSGIAIFIALALVVATMLHSLQSVMYLGVWMLGATVAWSRQSIARIGRSIPYPILVAIRLALAAALIGAALVARATAMPLIFNLFFVAIPSALLLAVLVLGGDGCDQRNRFRFASWLAASSFSLYAIHEPILIFAAAAAGIDVDRRWPSDVQHWAYLGVVAVCFVLLAWVFASVTERHTGRVRTALKAVGRKRETI